MGFELEFKSKILNKQYGEPWRFSDKSIKIKDRELARVGKVGADGPLWELRTYPVCHTQAKKQLLDAFRVLSFFEATSGKHCGLHVNVSCKRKNLHSFLDPLLLAQRLDSFKLAKLFDRQKLEVCKSPKDTKPFSLFYFYARRLGEEDRNLAINFVPYRRAHQKNSRVEFRFMGGVRYHRKPALCTRIVDYIVESMAKSYRK